MIKNHYSRKTRLLSRTVAELKVKMESPDQSIGVIHRLKLRIKFLLQELSGFVPKHQLKRILGAFAVVFGFAGSTQAQTFLPPVQNPFGLVPQAVDLQFQDMADLDGDGDLDILAGAYYGDIVFYENTGTSAAPAFAAPVISPFGLSSSSEFDIPALVDLDGDGDFDVLIGQYYGEMVYHENVGTATAPSFGAAVPTPFGLTATYYVAFPDFADLDNDGDMDLIVGEAYGALQYFENTGTATAPSFAAPIMNPFGLSSVSQIAAPQFGDVDQDGDLDLLVGEYYGSFQFFENTGTASAPSFIPPITDPFGLSPTYYWAFPILADLDDDGDLDLMASEYYGVFQYFENSDISASITEIEINGSISPNPFTDQLNFNFDLNVVQAEFINLAGQIVLTVENPNANIDASSIDAGVYIINCTHQNGQQTKHKIQKL